MNKLNRQSLFRLVELQDGAIEIDGIDIKSLGLTDLRFRLTVIPQACDVWCLECVHDRVRTIPSITNFVHVHGP